MYAKEENVMAIVCFVLAIILTVKIGKVLFKNTMGTTFAYAWRYMLIFFIILFVLAGIFNKIGLM